MANSALSTVLPSSAVASTACLGSMLPASAAVVQTTRSSAQKSRVIRSRAFLQQGVVKTILFRVGCQLQFGLPVDVHAYGIVMTPDEGGHLCAVFLRKDRTGAVKDFATRGQGAP